MTVHDATVLAARPFVLKLADCLLQGPNSNQVPVVYVADIIRAQGGETLSVA